MDAVQIMTAPVAADAGMAALSAIPAESSAVAGTGTTNAFGALLAMNMLGSTEPASSVPSTEEAITLPDTTISTEIDLLLASQLAALQMNNPLLPTTINAPQILAEDSFVSSVEGALGTTAAAMKTVPETTEQVLESRSDGFTLSSAVMETLSDADPMTIRTKAEELAVSTSVQCQSKATEDRNQALVLSENSEPLEVALKVSEVAAGTAVLEQMSVESQSKEVGAGLDDTGLKQQGVNQENKLSNDVSGQKPVVKLADTASAGEELKQADKGTQETEKLQVPIVTKQSGDVLRPERQMTTESQPVPQEVAATVQKPTTPAVQQVRFAQPTDVIVATSDTTGQNGLDSNAEQQNPDFSSKLAKQSLFAEEIKPGAPSAESVATPRTSEPQWLNLHAGQKTAEAATASVAETSRTVVPEQVGRQVMERLASHEVKRGNDQISFRLSPENLGNLQLNMRMEDQRLKLEIVAENREVKNALMQQADELKETLAKQNIRMDSFDVTLSSNGNHQQNRDWKQMGAEQRQYQPQQYASRMSGGSANEFEAPVRYFAPQYQSTIDVRF